jgi:hypothetical protein
MRKTIKTHPISQQIHPGTPMCVEWSSGHRNLTGSISRATTIYRVMWVLLCLAILATITSAHITFTNSGTAIAGGEQSE